MMKILNVLSGIFEAENEELLFTVHLKGKTESLVFLKVNPLESDSLGVETQVNQGISLSLFCDLQNGVAIIFPSKCLMRIK